MTIQAIHQAVITLTNSYEELNAQWRNDRCVIDYWQILKQESYWRFYDHNNNNNFEALILEIVSNSIEKTILNRLRTVIENNIEIYEIRKNHFSQLDRFKLCSFDVEYKFDGKLAVLQQDKTDIQNEVYPTSTEKENLLQETEREIYKLISEKDSYARSVTWLLCDYYAKIYELSKSFHSIINAYLPKEPEAKTQLSDKPDYFNMKIVSLVHEECNNEQFENISEPDLYSILNNKLSTATLSIKNREKIRTCYLLHKLYEHIKTEDKTEWLTYVLQLLNIKESFYKSKYKEATSDYSGSKSNLFVSRIDKIFQ